MGGAEQVGVSSCRAGRETGEASGQEVGKCPTSMPPVVIADGLESQGAGRVYRSITSRPILGADGEGRGESPKVILPPGPAPHSRPQLLAGLGVALAEAGENGRGQTVTTGRW